MGWARYEGRALADITLTGAARDSELEGYIRLHNPHLTDVRVEQAAVTEEFATHLQMPARWYDVTYLADDGQGYAVERP